MSVCTLVALVVKLKVEVTFMVGLRSASLEVTFHSYFISVNSTTLNLSKILYPSFHLRAA
jgi:hypothetical protein